MRLDQKGSPVPLGSGGVESRPAKRLHGFLRLTASLGESGRTVLSSKAYRPPIHISKPYWDGSSLLLNVMSPTAGLLEGDRVDVDVRVKSGARLALSNPTALRIHHMDDDDAVWSQRLSVEPNGFLEVHPDWIIPQKGSRFRQSTRIEIEPEGQLFFIEAMAPGRVAFGESFQFRSFRNRFQLSYGSGISAIENWGLQSASRSISGWRSLFKDPFYMSIYLCAPSMASEDPFFQFVHEQQTETVLCGVSALQRGPCWNIKLLSPDPAALRATLEAIRARFYDAIGLPLADLRK